MAWDSVSGHPIGSHGCAWGRIDLRLRFLVVKPSCDNYCCSNPIKPNIHNSNISCVRPGTVCVRLSICTKIWLGARLGWLWPVLMKSFTKSNLNQEMASHFPDVDPLLPNIFSLHNGYSGSLSLTQDQGGTVFIDWIRLLSGVLRKNFHIESDGK